MDVNAYVCVMCRLCPSSQLLSEWHVEYAELCFLVKPNPSIAKHSGYSSGIHI